MSHPWLLRQVASLNELDLTNKYWTKKNSPPLCSAFRHVASSRYDIDKGTYNYPNYHFYKNHAEITVTFPDDSEIPAVARLTFKCILQSKAQAIEIFTDASKSTTGTGCAYIVPRLNK